MAAEGPARVDQRAEIVDEAATAPFTPRPAIQLRDASAALKAPDARPRPALVRYRGLSVPHRARCAPASSTISARALAQTGEIVPFCPA